MTLLDSRGMLLGNRRETAEGETHMDAYYGRCRDCARRVARHLLSAKSRCDHCYAELRRAARDLEAAGHYAGAADARRMLAADTPPQRRAA